MDQEAALRAVFDLRTQFDRVWPWLAAAVIHYGSTHDKEDIWKAIEGGTAHLWPLSRSAMVTTIDSYPTGLTQVRGWLAGGDLREIVEYIPTIEKWAKDCCNCTQSVIVGRRGWLKAFDGYSEAATMMVKDL